MIGTLCTIQKGLDDCPDGSEGIRSLRSIIDKTVIKPFWRITELDFFTKLKPVSTFLLTGFYVKIKLSPENVLLKYVVSEIILSDVFEIHILIYYVITYIVRLSYIFV